MTPTNPLRRACALVPALCGALLGACASAPTVSLVSAELVESTDEGSVVAFTVAADNVADSSLPLRVIDYSADAAGMHFSGVRAGEATLRSKGVQLVTFPASFPGRVSLGESAAVRGSLGYVAPGPLAAELFDMGIYRPSVSFAGAATVEEPKPKPPPIRSTPVLRRAPEPTPPAPPAGAAGGESGEKPK